MKDSSALSIAQFEMLGDGKNDVKIPTVLLYRKEADLLLDALELNPNLIAHITNIVDETEEKPMIKLVNSLKEARRLLDLQFEKQNDDEYDKKTHGFVKEIDRETLKETAKEFDETFIEEFMKIGRRLVSENEQSLNDIKKDLDNLRNVYKDKLDDVFNNDQVQTNIQNLYNQYSKLKDFVLNKHHLETLPNLIKRLEPSIAKLLKSDARLKDINAKFKRKDVCLWKKADDFRNYITNDYWICK